MTLERDTLPAAADPEPDGSAPDLTADGVGGRIDRSFRRVALAAGLTVLLALLLIAVVTTNKAWPAFSELGGSYFFGTEWVPSEGLYGIVPLVFGTILVSVLALVVAVPISVGIALFVTEVVH